MTLSRSSFSKYLTILKVNSIKKYFWMQSEQANNNLKNESTDLL